MREASIHLSNAELDAFGLTEFVAVFRDAGLQEVNELSCQRPGCLLAITVTDHISEDQLSALSEVEWWEQLDGDSGVTYLCKLSVPAFDEGFDPHHETDTARESMTVTDEGVTITMVGDHESVSNEFMISARPVQMCSSRQSGNTTVPSLPSTHSPSANRRS
jgi:hypothetical protein